MLATERPQFVAIMQQLGLVYDRAVGEQLLNAYWDALRDVPLAVLNARVAAYVRDGKFFPKPRDLRHNPDGLRQVTDTRSPDVPVDDWMATLNRILRDVLMASHGVSDDTLAALVLEKNRLARQMREAQPTAEEFDFMARGIVAQLMALAQKEPEVSGMVAA